MSGAAAYPDGGRPGDEPGRAAVLLCTAICLALAARGRGNRHWQAMRKTRFERAIHLVLAALMMVIMAIGFVLANRGLMAGVSFDGSRISPLNLQN